MSHGPGGDGETCEPNLTPLLDIVLQLMMFFMMTVNFVNEQVSGEIQLPTSRSAVPVSKTENDVLFLNIKIFHMKDYAKAKPEEREFLARNFNEDDPCVLVIGEDYPKKLLEVKQLLKTRYADLLKLHGKVTTIIIIRADEKLDYAPFFQVLTMCKDVGFKQLKVRALTQVGGDA